jgi:hypothetical protein
MNSYKLLGFAIIFMALFSGCHNAINHTRLYSYPHSGATQNVNLAVKDFESKGIIFATFTVTTDRNNENTGSQPIWTALMEKAAERGADDIINIRIDKTEVFDAIDIEDSVSGEFKERKYRKKTIVWTANALAIKYTNAVVYQNASYRHIEDRLTGEDKTTYAVAADKKLAKYELWAKSSLMLPANSQGSEYSDNTGIGFEVSGIRYINELIGFGAGMGLSNASQERTVKSTRYESYGNGYGYDYEYTSTEGKDINPFDIFGIFVVRLDFLDLYLTLGTRQSLGIQKTFFERLTLDISYNLYPLHESDGFFRDRQTVNLSAGYKFKLAFL